MRKFPFPYFLAFLTYSFILFIEKIAFNSHALIEHDHGDHAHGHEHGHSHDHKGQKPKNDRSKIELDERHSSELCKVNLFFNIFH